MTISKKTVASISSHTCSVSKPPRSALSLDSQSEHGASQKSAFRYDTHETKSISTALPIQSNLHRLSSTPLHFLAAYTPESTVAAVESSASLKHEDYGDLSDDESVISCIENMADHLTSAKLISHRCPLLRPRSGHTKTLEKSLTDTDKVCSSQQLLTQSIDSFSTDFKLLNRNKLRPKSAPAAQLQHQQSFDITYCPSVSDDKSACIKLPSFTDSIVCIEDQPTIKVPYAVLSDTCQDSHSKEKYTQYPQSSFPTTYQSYIGTGRSISSATRSASSRDPSKMFKVEFADTTRLPLQDSGPKKKSHEFLDNQHHKVKSIIAQYRRGQVSAKECFISSHKNGHNQHSKEHFKCNVKHVPWMRSVLTSMDMFSKKPIPFPDQTSANFNDSTATNLDRPTSSLFQDCEFDYAENTHMNGYGYPYLDLDRIDNNTLFQTSKVQASTALDENLQQSSVVYLNQQFDCHKPAVTSKKYASHGSVTDLIWTHKLVDTGDNLTLDTSDSIYYDPMGISIAVLSETESTVSPPDVRSQSRLSIGRQSIVSEKNDMTAFSRNDFQPSPAPWSEYDINDDGMRARPRSGKRHNKLFFKNQQAENHERVHWQSYRKTRSAGSNRYGIQVALRQQKLEKALSAKNGPISTSAVRPKSSPAKLIKPLAFHSSDQKGKKNIDSTHDNSTYKDSSASLPFEKQKNVSQLSSALPWAQVKQVKSAYQIQKYDAKKSSTQSDSLLSIEIIRPAQKQLQFGMRSPISMSCWDMDKRSNIQSCLRPVSPIKPAMNTSARNIHVNGILTDLLNECG
ncbi:hypothetical protein BDV3_000255 [Batrachochytrium dendrobatidis]